jgi:23S rRNA (cytidine1920-2'-O)/16S rRNA (cytidine1409-2'-O)-methyltransferase
MKRVSANKARLDTLLVAKGLSESREKAKRLIMAGEVLVDDRIVDKPGTRVSAAAELAIKGKLPFVSRGGVKLEAALDRFELDVRDMVALDAGASTGGFTDCLLQRGISKVYAVDVGYGQLAWKLRSDPRVVVMDRTNIRYLESLPERVDLAVIDTSFISLELVLPAVVNLLAPCGQVIGLVKPQFEAGRGRVGRGGVVRDPAIHRQVLHRICELAHRHALVVLGLMLSPLRGPAGNVEFLLWATMVTGAAGIESLEEEVEGCVASAHNLSTEAAT